MLPPRQKKTWIRLLEEQGCKVREGKKGLVVQFPDGHGTAIHTSTSDRRAGQAAISEFRRHGIRHPLDTKEAS